mgnify:CR=1 FL=1
MSIIPSPTMPLHSDIDPAAASILDPFFLSIIIIICFYIYISSWNRKKNSYSSCKNGRLLYNVWLDSLCSSEYMIVVYETETTANTESWTTNTDTVFGMVKLSRQLQLSCNLPTDRTRINTGTYTHENTEKEWQNHVLFLMISPKNLLTSMAI